MSGYQYLEFNSIGRSFTNDEREEILSWSSRARVTQKKAVFKYSYSDFPREIEDVFLKYFDAFLYIASWGSKRLMFKLPKELVNYKKLKTYAAEISDDFRSGMSIYQKAKHVIVDIEFSDEEGEEWIIDEHLWLSDLRKIRKDLLKEDYRSLFIVWLHITRIKHSYEELEADFGINRKMIPAGLNKLNIGLESLIEFFEINKDWVRAAAMYSVPQTGNENDKTKLISKLPDSVKDDFLHRLLKEEVNLSIKLNKELTRISKQKKEVNSKAAKISMEELQSSVGKAIEIRKAEKEAADKKAFLEKMQRLSKNESWIKMQIDENIDKGTGSSYDVAFSHILDMKELAIYNDDRKRFEKYIRMLVKKYSTKPAMMRRLREGEVI